MILSPSTVDDQEQLVSTDTGTGLAHAVPPLPWALRARLVVWNSATSASTLSKPPTPATRSDDSERFTTCAPAGTNDPRSTASTVQHPCVPVRRIRLPAGRRVVEHEECRCRTVGRDRHRSRRLRPECCWSCPVAAVGLLSCDAERRGHRPSPPPSPPAPRCESRTRHRAAPTRHLRWLVGSTRRTRKRAESALRSRRPRTPRSGRERLGATPPARHMTEARSTARRLRRRSGSEPRLPNETCAGPLRRRSPADRRRTRRDLPLARARSSARSSDPPSPPPAARPAVGRTPSTTIRSSTPPRTRAPDAPGQLRGLALRRHIEREGCLSVKAKRSSVADRDGPMASGLPSVESRIHASEQLAVRSPRLIADANGEIVGGEERGGSQRKRTPTRSSAGRLPPPPRQDRTVK